MKPEYSWEKRKKIPCDRRGAMVHVGDAVLVRDNFPFGSRLICGNVEKLRVDDEGTLIVKVNRKWYRNPWKLADK